MPRRRLFSALSLTLLLGACTSPAPLAEISSRGDYGPTEKYLARLVDQEMAENDITGLSIALVDDQRIIWQAGFGYADLANKVPATPETIYRAGSIAKLFTAVATMQLAEQGKLDIDQALLAALPDFAIKSRFPTAGPVTPRNIMSHHSGLPSNFLRGMFVREPGEFESIVASLHDEQLSFPPNYVFAYSNVGMALLGTTVEQVSGEGFNDYVATHIFKPLGMTQSRFARRATAKAYDKNKEIEVFSLRDMPAANLLSNVTDLSQFIKMQFAEGRPLLSASSAHEMLRSQNAGIPLTFDAHVGLGWMLHGIAVPGGGIVASHGGSLPDSHSMLALLPEHKLGVVVLSNSASAHESVSKIAAIALRLMLASKTGINPEPVAETQSPERAASPSELAALNGYFDTLVGLVKVSTQSSAINAEAAGHQFRLVAHEDGLFTLKYRLFGLLPVRVSAFDNIRLSLTQIDGRQILLGKMDGETIMFGEKLQKTPIPESFRQALGQYEIVEKIDGPSPSHIELKESDGMLIGELRFAEKPELLLRIGFQALSEDEGITAGLGSGRGDTLRLIQSAGEQRLAFSGHQLRRKSAPGLH